MPATQLNLVIDQGEDWTVNFTFTDERDEPMPLKHPFRMDIKDLTGQIVQSLLTEDNPGPSIPGIVISNTSGTVQLHLTNAETGALDGAYVYDLFGTVEDGGVYAGDQIVRFIAGRVFVNKRVTESF